MIKCAVLAGHSHMDSGGRIREEKWIPFTTKEAPTPKAIVQLVKCGCHKNRCSNKRCLLEIRVEPALNPVLAVTVMIPEKMHVKILIH